MGPGSNGAALPRARRRAGTICRLPARAIAHAAALAAAWPIAISLSAAWVILPAPPALAQEISADIVRGDLRAEKFVEAEKHAREYLAATERLHGADARATADALDLLAESLRKAAKTHEPEALRVCQRAVEIKERLLPPGDPALAISLENLGALHLFNGDLEKARPPLERALEIRTRALGPEAPDVAWSLIWMAHLEQRSAHDDSAYALAKRAVAIQDSVLRDDDFQRIKGLNLLGAVCFERGDFRQAAPLFERALGLQLAARGVNNPSTASALHNLGAVYAEMGDYGEAQRYYEQARAIMRRVLPPGDPQLVRTLHGLAINREKQGDLAGALALEREACRIQRDAFGPENSDVGLYTMWVGRFELALGRRAAARRTLNDALKIQERALGPTHPDLAWTLRALAEADLKSGAVDLAVSRGSRALEIQESSIGPNHPDVAFTLADLARYRAAQGDTAAAFDLALRSAQIREEQIRLTLGGLSERQGLAYAAEGPTGLDVALSLVASAGARGVPRAVDRTWDALVRTRTLVLDEMAARHATAVAESTGEAGATAAAALREARQRLANLLVRGPVDESPERYQALLRTARLEMERAERTLGAKSERAGTGGGTSAGLEDVQAALPRGWGLVAYASYVLDRKRHYLAFVHADGGPNRALPIGDAERVDRLVRQWTEKIGVPPRDDVAAARSEATARTAGRSLRAAIWDPVAQPLGPVEGVLIVPDGSLHGINQDALPADDGSYLVEGAMLRHYVTSELDIVSARRAAPHGSGLLALGGADFGPSSKKPPKKSRSDADGSGDGATDCNNFYDASFSPLPQSRLEVEEISTAWTDSTHATILSGNEATEEAFKRLAPGRRVLHLATHGFFLNPTRCLQELAGARGIGGLEIGVRSKPRPAFDQQSPLLLSGLALADANRRSEATPHEEDGILTAEEVASLDLRGVEWAVLSACDTGVAGSPRGEGILGLRRAFRTAGVATLVISLWPVQDVAAREWMRAFYHERFGRGADTARAVRGAMLEVLRGLKAQGRSTDPFYWAAFVATGDWE